MLQRTKNLLGYTLSTLDGDIGEIKDFYFDDLNWTLRYLVVETGNWLFGKKVLIAPQTIGSIHAANKTIEVDMTRAQVRDSPETDTQLPVSRQMEAKLSAHYSWSHFGGAGTGYPTTGMIKGAAALRAGDSTNDQGHDPHLRSYKHISEYRIFNKHGYIGEAEDFFVETEDWSLPFLLLIISGQIHEKTIVPTGMISDMDWESHRIEIDLSSELLAKSWKIDAEGFFSDPEQIKLLKKFGEK